MLYPDYSLPYISNVNSTIQKTVNVTGYDRVVLDFWTMCDTEYSLTGRTDYMMLEASSDGSNFTEVYKWDEAQLDYLNGDPADPT